MSQVKLLTIFFTEFIKTFLGGVNENREGGGESRQRFYPPLPLEIDFVGSSHTHIFMDIHSHVLLFYIYILHIYSLYSHDM